MGMDPLTIALAASAASSLYGAYSSNKTAEKNRDAVIQHQGQVNEQLTPYLQQGTNPFAELLLRSVGGSSTGTQEFNTGQDGFMQFLNRGGAQFDNSPQFQALKTMDDLNLGEQVAQLHASAGSLGQRFGTAMNRNEALLRSNALATTGARNAGIASQSFESGAQRGLQAQALLAQILGQAGGFQQNQQSQNINILSLLSGQPIPQQAPNAIPGAVGDIAQTLMFLPFLKQATAGTNRAPVNYPTFPNAGPYYVPGAPVY
jgi:hypothetical protein